jgi:hypothetical protein
MGVSEIPKVGTSTALGPHNFMCRPLIEMRSEGKLYPYQDLSNDMLHATYT